MALPRYSSQTPLRGAHSPAQGNALGNPRSPQVISPVRAQPKGSGGGPPLNSPPRREGENRSTSGSRVSLLSILGKLSLLFFLFIVLVMAPFEMIRLSDALKWPRLRIPGGRVLAGGLVLGAVAIWAYASRLFSQLGKGTPFVTDPPKQLVTAGLYRYSRNPIYVAHMAFVLSWFFASGAIAVLCYAALLFAIIQTTIVRWEEPGLRQRFGEDFVRYTHTVPRWLLVRPRSGA